MADKQTQSDLQGDLLLREVQEEVRREQIAKLWKQYGVYVVAAAVAIVAGIGGMKWWQADQAARIAATGARYDSAMRLAASGKVAEAEREFAGIAKQSSSGYAALSQLQVAAADLKAGKQAEALAAYEALGSDTSADSLLRDFARLQAAALRSGTADWTEMQNRLNDLVLDGNPWRFSARELLGLAALKAGREDDARKTFEQLLADRKVPPSIGQRAQVIMGQIVAAELAKPDAAKPDGAKSGGSPAEAKKP